VTQLAQHVASQDTLQRFTLIRFSHAGLLSDSRLDPTVELADDEFVAAADLMARTVDADFESTLEDVRRGKDVSALASSPQAALKLAQTIVDQSDNESHDVYLVSDFRSSTWNQPAELSESIKQLDSSKAQVNLVRCVENPHSNVVLTEFRPVEGIQAAGVPMFVEVVVKNLGVDVARQVTVALRVITPGAEETSPELATELTGILIEEIGPGESVSRRAQVFFANAGEHVLLAELPADAVVVDNRRWCVVRCEDGIPVLVVDGDPDQLNVRYLETVFQPSERVRTGIRADLQQPTFLRDATSEDLAKYQAMYLLDVPRLDDRAARNVEKFVKDGGGVAIFLGPQSDLGFYNGWYAGGAGLFPVPVQNFSNLPTSGDGAPDLQVEDHPLFRVLLGERNAFIGAIRVQQHATAKDGWTPPEASTIRTIARLRNGDPLWVEQRFGSGRVVTQLSSLAPRWNSWATQPTFPVLMLELQTYLSSQQLSYPDRLVGTPIEFNVDPRAYQPQVEFQIPAPFATKTESRPAPTRIKLARNIEEIDDEGRLLGLVRLGGQALGTDVGSTNAPGIYEARLLQLAGQYERRKFALNVDSSESNLELASLDRLTEATAGTNARLLDADELALAARDDDRFSWSQLLLFVLIGLLIAEQMLAYAASYHPSSMANPATAPRRGALR
jgi:hypothetical protein